MIDQCADAAEAELLFDVDIHLRPARHVIRGHLQQPLVAGMAFHADAQGAPRAARETQQALFGMLDLRQDVTGGLEQVIARLREPQIAARALPDLRAERAFELAHGMTQRRLREVQRLSRSRYGALPLHFPHELQMGPLQDFHMNSFHGYTAILSFFFMIWNALHSSPISATR